MICSCDSSPLIPTAAPTDSGTFIPPSSNMYCQYLGLSSSLTNFTAASPNVITRSLPTLTSIPVCRAPLCTKLNSPVPGATIHKKSEGFCESCRGMKTLLPAICTAHPTQLAGASFFPSLNSRAITVPGAKTDVATLAFARVTVVGNCVIFVTPWGTVFERVTSPVDPGIAGTRAPIDHAALYAGVATRSDGGLR